MSPRPGLALAAALCGLACASGPPEVCVPVCADPESAACRACVDEEEERRAEERRKRQEERERQRRAQPPSPPPSSGGGGYGY